MRIEVNGEGRDTAATTILGLVQELSLDPKKVAVERNLEIVPRSLHGETALAEGDRIELVQFVGDGPTVGAGGCIGHAPDLAPRCAGGKRRCRI